VNTLRERDPLATEALLDTIADKVTIAGFHYVLLRSSSGHGPRDIIEASQNLESFECGDNAAIVCWGPRFLFLHLHLKAHAAHSMARHFQLPY